MLVHDTAVSEQVIGGAIAVHKVLGPGYKERCYESALCIELIEMGVPFVLQVRMPLYYREQEVGVHRSDLIVADTVIVEIKTVEAFVPLHTAQLTAYLRSAKLRVGLILNFNVAILRHGIRRVVL